MFASLGRATHRHRRTVLLTAAVLSVLAGVWGTGVFGALVGGGFEDPASESRRAQVLIEETLGRQDSDVVLVYSSPSGSALTVQDASFRTAVETTLAALPGDVVAAAQTYWSTGSPDLVSADGRSTLATLRLSGADDAAREEQYAEIAEELAAPGLEVLRGGGAAVGSDLSSQIEEDITRAEVLSLPVVLVLLVLVFGSLAAAGLPLLIGGMAILGAFAVLRLVTLATDVSVFSINIVTMLGLGLAIDYALFVVSRFREELRARPRSLDRAVEAGSVRDALVATMDTAGRTVAVSGVTVAIALASLTFFPQMFLRSMGVGGMAAVVVAMLGALTVLPALLAVLGRRVDALRVPLPWVSSAGQHAAGGADSEDGGWARLARLVMRRPGLVVMGTLTALVVLGSPVLGIALGGIDTRVLPAGAESRVAAETMARDFASTASAPLEVVLTGADGPAVTAYAERLATLPGATGASVVAQEADASVVQVGYAGDPVGDVATRLVDQVRDVPAPAGGEALVAGQTAEFVDLLTSLGDRAPYAVGFVVLTTLVLLFLAFGSVVLPVKAVLMNVLSLSAVFGVLVWGFQDGNLEGLLGFTVTGSVEATQPLLILAIAFGLSMDYEVFLLSRVREEWHRTGDNTRAVAAGLQRSGRIITSAALLLVVVFAAFATSEIVFIQMIGVGIAVAIVVDATVVRALLVPATMRLLGGANWWLPGPLAGVYARFGLSEGPGHSASTAPAVQPVVPGQAGSRVPAGTP